MIGPLMIDLQGLGLSEEEQKLIRNPLVGGVILFSRNFESIEQVKDLCQSIKSVDKNILIAVDQEGGRVQRFKKGLTILPAMGEIVDLALQFKLDKNWLAKELGWLMALEIKSLGIDISFAPVLDINRKNSQIIGNRAFDNHSLDIVNLAGHFIEGMAEMDMPATAKHFPGHGGVCEDSHLELPVDPRKEMLLEQDFNVFAQLCGKLQGIMPAHVLYPEFDKVYPAGFSTFWIKQQLRQHLLFNGVVFSDDLTMEGAAQFGTYSQRAMLAQNAGCDMILICNNRDGVKQVIESKQLQVVSQSSVRMSKFINKQHRHSYHQLMQSDRRQKMVDYFGIG